MTSFDGYHSKCCVIYDHNNMVNTNRWQTERQTAFLLHCGILLVWFESCYSLEGKINTQAIQTDHLCPIMPFLSLQEWSPCRMTPLPSSRIHNHLNHMLRLSQYPKFNLNNSNLHHHQQNTGGGNIFPMDAVPFFSTTQESCRMSEHLIKTLFCLYIPSIVMGRWISVWELHTCR